MMKTFKTKTTTLGLVICAATFAPMATAACGDISGEITGRQASFFFTQRPRLLQAAYRPAQFAMVSDSEPSGASVVGLWKVTFLAKNSPPIPDSTMVDWGYAQWHSDGTEIMNSGGRAPATENFCLGVWAKTGHSTYKLNHVALSYDAASGALNGTVSIRERVTVDHTGNKYDGTFTIDVSDPSGNPVAHLAGEVTGERITADQ